MRTYLLSLGAGTLVGCLYACLRVKSPAPPLIALVGLLGIVIGEIAFPLCADAMAAVARGWLRR